MNKSSSHRSIIKESISQPNKDSLVCLKTLFLCAQPKMMIMWINTFLWLHQLILLRTSSIMLITKRLSSFLITLIISWKLDTILRKKNLLFKFSIEVKKEFKMSKLIFKILTECETLIVSSKAIINHFILQLSLQTENTLLSFTQMMKIILQSLLKYNVSFIK